MTNKIGFVLKSILLIGMILNHGCSGKYIKLKPVQFNKDAGVERSNLNNINRLFQQMKTQEETSQDYYFVLIGDSRNLVRSYKLNGFNFLAKQIYLARDREGKKRIFDKIKFIIHLGDFIYNGAEKMQWINLQRGFSQKDYAYDNYPYLKMLVESKPIFPVLGNHEIMRLRLRKETPYRNLADSNRGLNYFKQFFNWDNFIANANIITPIPGDLPEEIYRKLYLKLQDENHRKNLDKHYILKKDGHYYLRIYQENITEYAADRIKPTTIKSYLDKDKKQQVINDLYEIFKSLGYNVLPVLSSDSMICYAFEINNMVYLVLDSMSRGWHYNNFTEIKKALYKKKDQHRLHLFSKSDLNGQYEFFIAIADYVKKNGKKLVPFMHHSPLNSHNKIDKGGIEYNLKLMLGVEYQRKKGKIVFDQDKNNTFLDDIIFFNQAKADQQQDPDYIFTSCVHYFEKFQLQPKIGDQEFNKINWYITGGGGAEMSKGSDKHLLKYSTSLYNRRLLDKNHKIQDTESLIKSIEIKNNRVRTDYHFLVVHVQGGKITEVYPQFVGKKELHINPSTIFSNVKYTASTISSPAGFGNSINIDFFRLGFDKISHGLAFITWEPGTGFGGFNYDTLGNMNFVGLSTFRFLKFGLSFPRSEYTVTLLGSATLLDQKKVARDYMTVGIEAPVLYNFFGLGGVAKKWALGVHFLFPRKVKEGYDPDFGKDIKLLVDIIYKF